jgi:hypothetical protein
VVGMAFLLKVGVVSDGNMEEKQGNQNVLWSTIVKSFCGGEGYYWCLNSGPHACYTKVLPLELCLQPF